MLEYPFTWSCNVGSLINKHHVYCTLLFVKEDQPTFFYRFIYDSMVMCNVIHEKETVRQNMPISTDQAQIKLQSFLTDDISFGLTVVELLLTLEIHLLPSYNSLYQTHTSSLIVLWQHYTNCNATPSKITTSNTISQFKTQESRFVFKYTVNTIRL